MDEIKNDPEKIKKQLAQLLESTEDDKEENEIEFEEENNDD